MCKEQSASQHNACTRRFGEALLLLPPSNIIIPERPSGNVTPSGSAPRSGPVTAMRAPIALCVVCGAGRCAAKPSAKSRVTASIVVSWHLRLELPSPLFDLQGGGDSPSVLLHRLHPGRTSYAHEQHEFVRNSGAQKFDVVGRRALAVVGGPGTKK